MPVECQRNYQPDHLLGRLAPAPDTGRTRYAERLFNPRQRQMLGQPVKAGYWQNIRRRIKLAR
mgnify:CR=1 FL=1